MLIVGLSADAFVVFVAALRLHFVLLQLFVVDDAFTCFSVSTAVLSVFAFVCLLSVDIFLYLHTTYLLFGLFAYLLFVCLLFVLCFVVVAVVGDCFDLCVREFAFVSLLFV